ncbi:MAG: hypothetical protein IJZ98_03385 [Bacteroidales bacterium]|nr:hypothetical protein [Bacteroidales bacterium]
MLFDILAIISTVSVIILMRRLLNIYPSLLACIIRWKESINLEASVKHSLDRNMFAVAMIIPFCLIVYRFGIYSPAFMEGINETFSLLIIIGIFGAYFALRRAMIRIMRPKKMNPKTYKAAICCAYTFFIILTLTLFFVGGIMALLKTDPIVTRTAIIWLSAIIYGIYIFRKTQIFTSSCSIFRGFLYLCGLEIFPTGVLVASALIL